MKPCIQGKVRGEVRDVADDIEGVDGRSLIKTIKLELTEREYPLDLGAKILKRSRKSQCCPKQLNPQTHTILLTTSWI